MIAEDKKPHKLALQPDVIHMMQAEVEDKVRCGFAAVVYLDEIEDLLG